VTFGDLRQALIGARLARKTVEAGMSEGDAVAERYRQAGVPMTPVMQDAYDRLQRTLTGARRAEAELEIAMELRADLHDSLAKHWDVAKQTGGLEWLVNRVARDLGI
jgi:phosphoserine phosphatase